MSDEKIPAKLQANAIDILDMIAGGADEIEVINHFKIRMGTFIQWQIMFPKFESAVAEARKQRADSFRSIIQNRLYVMEGGKKVFRVLEKEEVPGEKLIFDKLKWLAEIDNPEKYGTKVKHEGGNVMPVQIVVDTGIKPGTQPVVEVSKEEEEDKSKSVDYNDMDF